MAISKKIIIPLAIIGGLGVAAAVAAPAISNGILNRAAEQKTRETAVIEKRTLVESISASGTVSSVKEKDVLAALTGVKVQEVFVEVGDEVKKGDPLCAFDMEDIEYDLAMTEDALSVSGGINAINVNSAARALNEALETRNIELERADKDTAKAWNDYVEAQEEYEKAERDLNSARQTTAEKNGELQLRQRRLAEAQEAAENAAALASDGAEAKAAYDTALAEFSALIAPIAEIKPSSDAMERLQAGDTSVNAYNDFDYVAEEDIDNAENQSMVNSYLTKLSSLSEGAGTLSQSSSVPDNSAEITALTQEIASFEAKLAAARQSEAAAEAAYKQTEATAKSLFTAYEQRVRLADDTKRNMDSAVAARQDAVQQAALNGRLTGQTEKRTIRQLNAQLKDGTALAPMNGVITSVSVNEGNIYTGTVIATIEDISGYEITSEINEYDIGKIKVGQRVVIKTNGTGDDEMEGKITHINPRATRAAASAAAGLGTVQTPISGDVTYQIKIEVLTDNDLIRMDMTAKLSIIIEESADTLTVPYDALLTDEDGTFYVEVITNREDAEKDAQQETKRVDVEKGIESDYYIEVISKELKEGDEVLLPENTDITDLYDMLGIEGPMDGL